MQASLVMRRFKCFSSAGHWSLAYHHIRNTVCLTLALVAGRLTKEFSWRPVVGHVEASVLPAWVYIQSWLAVLSSRVAKSSLAGKMAAGVDGC